MPIACSLPISRSNLTNLATTLSTASISTNLDNKVVLLLAAAPIT